MTKTSAKRPSGKTANRGAKDAAAKSRYGKVGSSFDNFLREEGVYEETHALAVKRVLSWALTEEMKRLKLTKTAMAKRMNTSRSQLDRLLDPGNADVKLETLARAARAVDRELRIELVG